jgi:hypothetical protein
MFPGSPPPEVRRWFRRGSLWVEQPARVDEYLLFPGCTSVGIKMRQGLLEVKALSGEAEIATYPGGAGGYRESWVKWSRPAAGVEGAENGPRLPGEAWVSLSKRRTLREFSLDGVDAAAVPFEVDAGVVRPRAGAAMEITELRVLPEARDSSPASVWWTLAFEGFDAAGETTACLDRVARHVLAAEPSPLPLDVADSASYAAWLASGRWRNPTR